MLKGDIYKLKSSAKEALSPSRNNTDTFPKVGVFHCPGSRAMSQAVAVGF